MKRISIPHQAGLFNMAAPLWKGQTAEARMAERKAEYTRIKEEKRLKRRGNRPPGEERPPLSPSRQLTKLRRALTRRKTHEGRLRVQQRINELERQMH